MDTKAYLYRQEAMKRWILLFIVSLFSLFVLGTYAIAAERYYDESGRYMGRMDDSGRMYDKSGRYQGRVSEDGRFYDNSGRYQGRQRPLLRQQRQISRPDSKQRLKFQQN